MSLTDTIDPHSPLAQALRELLLDERANAPAGPEAMRELAGDTDWWKAASACAEVLRRQPRRSSEEVAFLRGAALALRAAEVARRRGEPFYPPTE